MPDGTLPVAAGIAMGLVLAACAGLRAFLPLLALGVAARAGVIHLAPELSWLASTPSLVVLGSALVFEVAADKVPMLDHILDAVGVVVRPLAGGLAAVIPFLSAGPDGSMFTTLTQEGGAAAPWLAAGAGAMTGGTVTALVHLARAGLRVASSAMTGGLANPVLSLLEDGLGLTTAAVALVLPLLALAAVVAAGLAVTVWLRRLRAR
jgi:hypothetical protein